MSMKVKLIDIGDRVVMDMDRDARAWGQKGVPNGTEGTVIGKARHRRYAARFGLDTFRYKTPGIYEMDSGLIVKWDDGSISGHNYDATLLDKNEYEDRLANRWTIPVWDNGRDMYEVEAELLNEKYVGPLPETEYWEGDLIRADFGGRSRLFRVESIDHQYFDKDSMRRDDGSMMPIYNVRFSNSDGSDAQAGSTYIHQDDPIQLIRRGNLWKMYHNLPLVFNDLTEEVSFYRGLHQYQDIKNPDTGYYNWTLEEALQAIKNGVGDGISGVLFSSSTTYQVYKMNNLILGDKLRRETLVRFNIIS